MNSRWSELRAAALLLRRKGQSLVFIEENLGIPRSTLYGWLKDIPLTQDQQHRLSNARLRGLMRGRRRVIEARRAIKQRVSEEAKRAAEKTLQDIEAKPEIMELVLAVLSSVEPITENGLVIRSASPDTLRFMVRVLDNLYGIRPGSLQCELFLRHDQDAQKETVYWSNELDIPGSNFKKVYFDKRTRGSTHDHYHGVCLVRSSHIAMQQKLVYLYRLFCEKTLSSGARSSVG